MIAKARSGGSPASRLTAVSMNASGGSTDSAAKWRTNQSAASSTRGADITATGGPGIAACKGAVNCLGYHDDPVANAELYTDDGWMRTGDLCTIDADGVLTVAGRSSDFIIRGGKNLSAAVIEQEVATMPGVRHAAAVAKPDPVVGERVCVFCAVDPGVRFDIDDLRAHLAGRGTTKELWPETLVIVDGDLPRGSGGKVAKGDLRARAREP